MFGWFRRRTAKARQATEATVHWAANLPLAEQQHLETLVRQYFANRHERVEISAGVVVRGGLHFGLENLAQLCSRVPRDEWSLAVEQHFVSLERARVEQAEWDERGVDFAWAAERLLLRVYPRDFLDDGRADWLVHRMDLPGTATILVADLPSSVLTLKRDVVDGWGRSAEELFSLALDQLADQCPVDLEWTELVAGSLAVAVLSAEHLYAATHALRLGEWPELVGPHGTLLAVPNRHTLIAYPIEDQRVLGAVQRLVPLVQRMFEQGPGSIAEHLFWRRTDGRFERQECRGTGEAVRMHPSPGFAKMLAGLAD